MGQPEYHETVAQAKPNGGGVGSLGVEASRS